MRLILVIPQLQTFAMMLFFYFINLFFVKSYQNEKF